MITGLALAVRLAVLGQIATSPGFSVPFLDEQRYLELAGALARGETVGEALFWQSPLYPWLLAQIPADFESLPIVVKVLQSVLGAATCGLTYLLGRGLMDRSLALGAGLLMAFYGPAIFYATQLLATTLVTFWTALLVLLVMRAASRPTVLVLLALGVSSGLSVLTRASFLPFIIVAFLGLGLAWRAAGQHRTLSLMLGLVVSTAITVTPAMIARQEATGTATVLPVSAGINLHIGNNEDRCSVIQIRGYRWDQLVREPFPDSMPPNERTDAFGDEYFRRKFDTYVREHPFEYASGLAFKAVQLFNGTEIPRNVDMYVHRQWSWLLGGLVWRVGPFGFPFGLVFPLAVLGWFARLRNSAWPLHVFWLTYGLSIIAVFVTARYRVPLIPVVSVLAAAGFHHAVELLKRLRTERTLDVRARLAIAATFVAFVLAMLPVTTCENRTNFAAEYHQIVGTYRLGEGKLDEAERLIRTAIRLNPRDGESHYNLGHVLMTQKNPDEALVHWRKTLEIYPDHAPARQNIGVVLLRQGKHVEAHGLLVEALEASLISADDFANIGLQLIQENRLDAASLFLRTAVDHSTSNPKARVALDLLSKMGFAHEPPTPHP